MSKQSEEWYWAEIRKRDSRIATLENTNAHYLKAIKDMREAAAMITAIAYIEENPA